MCKSYVWHAKKGGMYTHSQKRHPCRYSKEYYLAHAAQTLSLYTRGLQCKDGLYKQTLLQNNKQVQKAIGYGFPFEELAGCTHDGKVCVLVSRHLDDTLKHILVVPAVWPASLSTLRKAFGQGLTPSARKRGNISDDLTLRVCDALAQVPPAHLPHIPNPIHIDDWQAQYREHPQHVSDFKVPAVTARRNTIYVLRIDAKIHGQQARDDGISKLLPDLCNFIEVYFDSTCAVKLLDPLDVIVDLTKRHKVGYKTKTWRGKAANTSVDWRVKEGVAEDGQLCATDLLCELSSLSCPADTVCVLGVTMRDLYLNEDDDFTQGLAGGEWLQLMDWTRNYT